MILSWQGLEIDVTYDPGEPTTRGVYQDEGDPGYPPSLTVDKVTVVDDDEWQDAAGGDLRTPEQYVDEHYEDLLALAEDEDRTWRMTR